MAYDGTSGTLLWEVAPSQPVHAVSAITRAGQLAVTQSDGPLLILDVLDGSTIETIDAVRGLEPSPNQDLAVAWDDGGASMVSLGPWTVGRRLPLDGWDLLAVAFGSELVLVSTMADAESSAVYLLDATGALVWKRVLPSGCSAPRLGFDVGTSEWLAVVHDSEQRAPDRLVRLSADGSVRRSVEIGSAADYAFVRRGQLLVSPADALDTATGRVVARLIMD